MLSSSSSVSSRARPLARSRAAASRGSPGCCPRRTACGRSTAPARDSRSRAARAGTSASSVMSAPSSRMRPASGWMRPDDHVERRRLARPIRAQQSDDLALLQSQGHVVHDLAPAVHLHQPGRLEDASGLRRLLGRDFGDGVMLAGLAECVGHVGPGAAHVAPEVLRDAHMGVRCHQPARRGSGSAPAPRVAGRRSVARWSRTWSSPSVPASRSASLPAARRDPRWSSR